METKLENKSCTFVPVSLDVIFWVTNLAFILFSSFLILLFFGIGKFNPKLVEKIWFKTTLLVILIFLFHCLIFLFVCIGYFIYYQTTTMPHIGFVIFCSFPGSFLGVFSWRVFCTKIFVIDQKNNPEKEQIHIKNQGFHFFADFFFKKLASLIKDRFFNTSYKKQRHQKNAFSSSLILSFFNFDNFISFIHYFNVPTQIYLILALFTIFCKIWAYFGKPKYEPVFPNLCFFLIFFNFILYTIAQIADSLSAFTLAITLLGCLKITLGLLFILLINENTFISKYMCYFSLIFILNYGFPYILFIIHFIYSEYLIILPIFCFLLGLWIILKNFNIIHSFIEGSHSILRVKISTFLDNSSNYHFGIFLISFYCLVISAILYLWLPEHSITGYFFENWAIYTTTHFFFSIRTCFILIWCLFCAIFLYLFHLHEFFSAKVSILIILFTCVVAYLSWISYL